MNPTSTFPMNTIRTSSRTSVEPLLTSGGIDRLPETHMSRKATFLLIFANIFLSAAILAGISPSTRAGSFADTELNTLAGLCKKTGDYTGAKSLYQKVLQIREEKWGHDHLLTATTLNDLGVLYNELGNYSQAKPLLSRALRIRKTLLGDEHSLTAVSLNNLAAVYKETGDYSKAEPLLKRALEINEKNYGPDHPLTATSLNNLAMVCLWNGQLGYLDAEPLLLRALGIREKKLGPGHPLTAASLKNLSIIYAISGDLARYEGLNLRAITVKGRKPIIR